MLSCNHKSNLDNSSSIDRNIGSKSFKDFQTIQPSKDESKRNVFEIMEREMKKIMTMFAKERAQRKRLVSRLNDKLIY